MKKRGKVTIREVAKRVGVSPSTVSNALSGRPNVSEDTRLRVLAAVEELGYHPDLVARSLVKQRSEVIAVVAAGLEFYGPSRTLVGINRQARQLGLSLLLILLPEHVTPDLQPVWGSLRSRRVDGVIWAVHQVGDNRTWVHPEQLAQLPPIVFLTMEPQPQLPIVAVDNRAGIAQVIEHLVERGRRHIGLITGPLSWWEARERYLGWIESMQRCGLPASQSQIVQGDWTAASGECALRTLLTQHPELDAVVASNDQMALGVLRAAHLLGRRVPADLAVTGFDNIPESDFFWPPLTTVRQHLVDLGSIAVTTLHKLIEAKNQGGDGFRPDVKLLKPELIVRESA